MDATKFIRVEMVKHDKTITDLMELFGIARQSVHSRLKKNVWTVNDMEKIANFMDCDFVMEFRPRR